MPHTQPPPTFNPTKLRRLVQPPSEVEQLIEMTARQVAQHGSATEFQLRSGSLGKNQYQFLHLDHEFYPFYQTRLAHARARQNSTPIHPTKTNDVSNENGKSGSTTTDESPDRSSQLVEPENFDIADYIWIDLVEDSPKSSQTSQSRPKCPDRNAVTTGQPANDKSPLFPNLQKGDSDIHGAVENPGHVCRKHPGRSPYHVLPPFVGQATHGEVVAPRTIPSSIFDSLAARRGRAPNINQPHTQTQDPGPGITPYGLLQEVHILDTAGSERVGLNTFIIVERFNSDNNEKKVQDPLMHALHTSPAPVVGPEPVYRLRPVTSVNYRTSHHRLLPVGIALGKEVVYAGAGNGDGNGEVVVVVRRTVIQGRRVYDVKDRHGVVHKDVQETDLRSCSGGIVEFGAENDGALL